MVCPECNTQNNEGARYCRACGSPLMRVNDSAVARQPRRRSMKPLAICASVLFIALVGGLVAWSVLERKPVAVPTTNSIALYSDSKPLVAGMDGTAHMRLNIPVGSSDATVYDGDGNEVASFKADQMENGGDGILRVEFDLEIPARGVGVQTYSVVTTSADGRHADQTNVADLKIPVIPNNIDQNPVPENDSWVLADACDWVDQNCSKEMERPDAAAALVTHLKDDNRAKEVIQYGSTVMFGVGEGDNSALYCICLNAAKEGTLGSGDIHDYSFDGPAIRHFNAADEQKTVAPGMGITAGNVATNPNVLLLEPTPDLMTDEYAIQVEHACDEYATSLGGTLAKKTDEALSSILSGDLYGKGVVILRTHGFNPAESNTPLFRMHSIRKTSKDAWATLRSDLKSYLQTIADACSINMGEYFFGLPDVPDTWRCAITAHATPDTGVWDVGVAASTNLIEECYSNMDFENSVMCLSCCESLSNGSFDSWALAHGAQIVLGYKGVAYEQDDAQVLSTLLGGLATNSDEVWRSKNVGESLSEVSDDTKRSVRDSLVWSGNESFFSKGSSILLGALVGKDNAPIADAEVEAWRFFDGTFISQGSTATNENGEFQFDSLPCGRYVLDIRAAEDAHTATIVLDEQEVDGGIIVLEIGAGDQLGESAAPKNDLVLGASNVQVSADNDWLYLGVSYGYSENGTIAMPMIVRVNRTDASNYERLWEGTSPANITEVRLKDDRVFACITTWSEQSPETQSTEILSVKTDGTGVTNVADFDAHLSAYRPFAIDGDKVYYCQGSNENWEVHAVNVDGSGETKLCAGTTSSGIASSANILGVVDGLLYLAVPSSGADFGFNVVYAARLDGSGEYKEVMRCDGYGNPAILDGKIIATEGHELVKYSLEGTDREVIASLPNDVASYELYNVNSKYAIVTASRDGFLVDMLTKSVQQITMDEDTVINLVDDKIVAAHFGGGLIERRNTHYESEAVLWPPYDETTNNDAADVESKADDASVDSGAEVVQGDGILLSGRVHVHEEYMYSRDEYVLVTSIVLDSPMPYTYGYKGYTNDAVANDVALEVTSMGEQGYWAQYDGKHISVSCEALGGVYHDASYYNVDALALDNCTLVQVGD